MKLLIFYALGVYLIFIAAGIHLNNAHGGGLPAQTNGFPTIRSTEYPKHIEPAKTCGEYLAVCEKSCASRGDLFRFLCLGQGFNPESQRYRCQCGDDAFQPQVVKATDRNESTEKREPGK
jgi:hypothetical protein